MHKVLRSIIGVLLLTPALVSSQPEAPEEIVIIGRVPGPPMWQVKKGEHTLWLFGVLTPLPKNLDWDGAKVEAVLAKADGFLPGPNARPSDLPGPFAMVGLYRQYRKMRKLDNKQTLEDLLSAQEYAQLMQVKEKYGPSGKGVLSLRPFLAALELREAAMKKVGLRDAGEIYKDVGRLIKKYKVPEIPTELEIDTSFGTIMREADNTPLPLELACLQEVIAGLANDIAGRSERALAWSYGQMADLYDTDFLASQITCETALANGNELARVREQSRNFWVQQAGKALDENAVTFGVLDIDELLLPNGLLAALQQQGYQIIYP